MRIKITKTNLKLSNNNVINAQQNTVVQHKDCMSVKPRTTI